MYVFINSKTSQIGKLNKDHANILDRKTHLVQEFSKKQNSKQHPPDGIRKLCIGDKKRGNVMPMENPDEFINSWIHYRFTYDKWKGSTSN